MDKQLLYTPQYWAFERAVGQGGNVLIKYFRNSSSNFIQKPKVRAFVLGRDDNCCRFCKSIKNLHIDHIKPVAYATPETIYEINSLGNLRVLCATCNLRRKSDGPSQKSNSGIFSALCQQR